MLCPTFRVPKLWDLDKADRILDFRENTGTVTSVAFHPRCVLTW